MKTGKILGLLLIVAAFALVWIFTLGELHGLI